MIQYILKPYISSIKYDGMSLLRKRFAARMLQKH